MCHSSSKNYVRFSYLAVLMIGTIAQHAEAQRSGRSGLRLGNVVAVQLLVLDDVREELKLSGEQREKATAIHDAFVTQRRKVFAELPRESGARGPRLAEMNKQTTKKVEAILDEVQRQRLREILLQVNGAAELMNDEIATAIGLTDQQKEKLASLQRSHAKARSDARQELEGSSAEIRTVKMAELHQEAERKLVEVLTSEQRKQFESMQGKKIKLELFQL